MAAVRIILTALLSFILCAVQAQERGDYQYDATASSEPERMIEVDTTLFRMPITTHVDFYGEATRYYRAPGSSRRRGLYYTTTEQLINQNVDYIEEFNQPLRRRSITLYAAQSGYRVGLRGTYADMLPAEWSLSSELWAQTGRDMFVEGVFRNSFTPQVTLSKRFTAGSFLRIDASLYYSMRGMQYGSTPEAFALIGSPYYNPTWGFHNGKVRNSRVRRDFNPTLSLHYQYDLGDQRTLILEGDTNFSRRADSALGWYDATTPMPDYYRKMPSFLTAGQVQEYVTDLWRTSDARYTQINWEELVRLNNLSPDGEAFYVVEDRVSKRTEGRIAAIYHWLPSSRLTMTCGIEATGSRNRNFKILNDLLGADHLTDYDQFISDSYNKTMPLQNNLAAPNRKVLQGDRFGYDYTIAHSAATAVARMTYRAERLDYDISARIESANYKRIGHYEKERFAGNNSLGDSPTITCAPYDLRASIGYAHRANLYFVLKLSSTRLCPLENNLFLNAMAANYLAPCTTGEKINSASAAIRYNSGSLTLTGEVYALLSNDGAALYSLYDDLSGTMCRASITGIGYSSYGAELAAEFYLHHDLRLAATLAAGSYRYSTDADIELFDDYSLQTIASPTKSRTKGVNLGNAPQIIATTSASYFGFKHFILSASASCTALRYAQPSIARRSERLLTQAFINEQSAKAALTEERLGDIYDIEASATRFFWVGDGDYISLRIAVSNLLGQRERIYYARQSDRILLRHIDGYFTGATMREGLQQYGAPRTIKLSVSYKF